MTAGLRIVEARREHVPFVAWVLMTSHRSHLERGFFDLVVGGSDEHLLRYLQALSSTEQPHFAHHSIFLVAEVDGAPASAMCGYFEEELGAGRLRAGMLEANERCGRTEEDAAAGWARAMSILNVLPEHVPGAWIVEHVATLPEFRRQGLVTRLMEQLLERGRARGARVADISVLIGNDPAQHAYEGCGFRVMADRLDPEFEAAYRTPGIRLLRRQI